MVDGAATATRWHGRRTRRNRVEDTGTVPLSPSRNDETADSALDEVAAWFEAEPHVEERFRALVRRGLDEVIDGGRTGRWSVKQLAKTEKTYIGTKMEILVRDEFALPPGPPLDTQVRGHAVDIKWSESFAFEIARENVGQICLVVGGSEKTGSFGVGLVRPAPESLGAANQDKKRKLTKAGRETIRWIVPLSPLPPSFLATLVDDDRDAILAAPKGQARVRALFNRVQRRPIPRLAIETVACQRDPMRRVRQDKDERLGGVRVIGGHLKQNRQLAAALGVPHLDRDEWVSFPDEEVRIAEKGLRQA